MLELMGPENYNEFLKDAIQADHFLDSMLEKLILKNTAPENIKAIKNIKSVLMRAQIAFSLYESEMQKSARIAMELEFHKELGAHYFSENNRLQMAFLLAFEPNKDKVIEQAQKYLEYRKGIIEAEGNTEKSRNFIEKIISEIYG